MGADKEDRPFGAGEGLIANLADPSFEPWARRLHAYERGVFLHSDVAHADRSLFVEARLEFVTRVGARGLDGKGIVDVDQLAIPRRAAPVAGVIGAHKAHASLIVGPE